MKRCVTRESSLKSVCIWKEKPMVENGMSCDGTGCVTRLAGDGQFNGQSVGQTSDGWALLCVCTRCRSLFVRAWTTSAGLWELTASSQYGGHIGDRTTEGPLRMPPKHLSSMSSPLGGGAVASASLQNVVCSRNSGRPSVRGTLAGPDARRAGASVPYQWRRR